MKKRTLKPFSVDDIEHQQADAVDNDIMGMDNLEAMENADMEVEIEAAMEEQADD